MGLWHTHGSPNLCQKTRLNNRHKKKTKKKRELENCWQQSQQLKKKLWNMQVTIIPVVIGTFGTVTKGLLRGLDDLKVGGRVETIQTTTLLRTGQSTEKSAGDLMWLALTQTPVL